MGKLLLWFRFHARKDQHCVWRHWPEPQKTRSVHHSPGRETIAVSPVFPAHVASVSRRDARIEGLCAIRKTVRSVPSSRFPFSPAVQEFNQGQVRREIFGREKRDSMPRMSPAAKRVFASMRQKVQLDGTEEPYFCDFILDGQGRLISVAAVSTFGSPDHN
jgi:hypothetical protein